MGVLFKGAEHLTAAAGHIACDGNRALDLRQPVVKFYLGVLSYHFFIHSLLFHPYQMQCRSAVRYAM